MILLTGATGQIGTTLARLLAAKKVPVRALTRNPDRALPLPGVEWVRRS